MQNRIRELRLERKMTQIRLSIELEVSQETISAYEKGKYYPTFPMLIKLAKIFNTSIDYMMGLSNVRYPELSTDLLEEEYAFKIYCNLNSQQKEKATAYMQGLLD